MEPCMLEVLQKALDDGILDLSQLQESIAMKKKMKRWKNTRTPCGREKTGSGIHICRMNRRGGS